MTSIDPRQRLTGRAPSREYRCATCNVAFVASGTHRGGRTGKVCPNGHWHSIYQLERHEQGKTAQPRISDDLSGEKPAIRRETTSLIGRFRVLSFSSQDSQALVALGGWVASYEHLINELPSGPLRGLVEGQFSRIAALSRSIISR